MVRIRKLAFVLNASKPDASTLGQALEAMVRERGVGTVSTTQWPLEEGFLSGCDACCVIGGDGTLLGTVPEAIAQDVPVFGVNRGKLGFLATISEPEARACLSDILEGKYAVHERDALCCRTADGREAVALNDVVMKHQTRTHLVGLEVFLNKELVTDYFCDGLIFSTATGSTAYNLSAGGPIIHPDANVIGMTPICPHTLTNRTVIFPCGTSIQVAVVDKGESEPTIIIDGREIFEHGGCFLVTISTSTARLKLLQPHDYSHFAILRRKLRWGGGGEGRQLSV